MKPDPAGSGGAIRADIENTEGPMRPSVEGLVDAKELSDAEGLANIGKPIVVDYSLSVFCQH